MSAADLDVRTSAELEPSDMPVDPAPDGYRPEPPVLGYDLLAGAGQTRWKARRLNRRITAAAAIAVVAVATAAYATLTQRDAATVELAAVTAEIDQLNRDLTVAADSLLSEADLASHVTAREQTVMAVWASELPYAYLYTALLDAAAQTGVTVTAVDVRNPDVDGGATVSGTAPDLQTIGDWNVHLLTVHGLDSPHGFVDQAITTYRSVAGEQSTEAFTTSIRFTVAALQTQAACHRASLAALQPDQCVNVPALPTLAAATPDVRAPLDVDETSPADPTGDDDADPADVEDDR